MLGTTGEDIYLEVLAQKGHAGIKGLSKVILLVLKDLYDIKGVISSGLVRLVIQDSGSFLSGQRRDVHKPAHEFRLNIPLRIKGLCLDWREGWASSAGASALGGEGGAVTFPVISVHCEGGAFPALPKIGPAAIVQAPSSAGFGFGTGVAGATAGDAFFRVAHTFDLRAGPFFI